MILRREINELSAKLLLRIYRQSRHHQVRQRTHCLLLINQGQKKLKNLWRLLMLVTELSIIGLVIGRGW